MGEGLGIDLDLGDVAEPDAVQPCPNCDGEVVVFLKHYEQYGICSVKGVIHVQPDEEDGDG